MRRKLSFIAVLLGVSACLGPSADRPTLPAERPAGGTRFMLPLAGARVMSPFGRRRRDFHEGIDLQRTRGGGEPVKISADGLVVEATRKRGYGRQVLIRHADGWYTRYAHLRSFRVKTGQSVRQGETLGQVGATGRATAPHLHFEILTPQRRPVDPAPHIFGRPADEPS